MITIKLLDALGFTETVNEGMTIWVYKRDDVELESTPVENKEIAVSGDIGLLDIDSFYTTDSDELVDLIIMVKNAIIELGNEFYDDEYNEED